MGRYAFLPFPQKGKIASYPEIKLRITYGGMPDDAKPKKTPGVVTSLDGYPILETKFEHTGARIVKRFSDLKVIQIPFIQQSNLKIEYDSTFPLLRN